MLLFWRVSPSIGAFGALKKMLFCGGFHPRSELFGFKQERDMFFWRKSSFGVFCFPLEGLALNPSFWFPEAEFVALKKNVCFSVGFRPQSELLVFIKNVFFKGARPHLELVVLMDMSDF